MPIVISDDECSSHEPAPQPAPQPVTQRVQMASLSDFVQVMHEREGVEPAAKVQPAAKVEPPKAKPAKRKRVSQSTLNGWREHCGCKYPQDYDTCDCQDYKDFLLWEKMCTCKAFSESWCKCAARKAPMKK